MAQPAFAGIDSLTLASNGNVFIAMGMAAVSAGFGNRAGYFIGVDASVGGSLSEIPRLAIGLGGVGAAFVALGETLVDAIAIRLVGNDENATVGQCCRPDQEERTGQKHWNGSHAAPMNEGIA
jgi:hypothetical protein